MGKKHSYRTTLEWTGNRGTGTESYSSYERSYTVRAEGKQELDCSSDPVFRGDASKYNPEDLLVAALSACHMLWYLHLCSEEGVIVTHYSDAASGTMELEPGGAGHFTEVTLRPHVTVSKANMIATAEALHRKAHEYCFIAASVNFPVTHLPETEAG